MTTDELAALERQVLRLERDAKYARYASDAREYEADAALIRAIIAALQSGEIVRREVVEGEVVAFLEDPRNRSNSPIMAEWMEPYNSAMDLAAYAIASGAHRGEG